MIPRFVFLLLCGLLTSARGQELCSIPDISRFTATHDGATCPFALTGTVCQVIRHTTNQSILLTRNGERILLQLSWTNTVHVNTGDRIAMRGSVFVSKTGETVIRGDIVAVLGHEKPTEPPFVPLPALNVAEHNLNIIRTEGTVVGQTRDGTDVRFVFLILRDGAHQIPVAIKIPSPILTPSLNGCRIRLKGLYRRSIDGSRHFCGPFILLLDDEISVMQSSPADPFLAEPLDESINRSTGEIFATGPRKATGTVLATWQDRKFMLETDRRRIVIIHLSEGESLPPCGTRVDAVGAPGTDLYTLSLNHARWRTGEGAALPAETPNDFRAAQLLCNPQGRPEFHPEHQGKLVRIRGILTGLANGRGERRARLSCQSLELGIDYSSSPNAFENIALDSTIEVVGRVRLDTHPWSPYDIFPDIEGVSIVPRSPDDVIVVQRPPWWTPARFATAILLLGVALGAVILKNALDRKLAHLKFDERTRLAIELHDSMSQALAGISCQLSAASDGNRRDPETLFGRLRVAERMLDSCKAELKNCLFDLRSNTLGEPDFAKAIRMTLGSLAGDISLRVRVTVTRSRLNDEMTHAVLAIVRELVSNAIRHGMAATVFVGACIDRDRLFLSVRDDGCGFDPERIPGIDEGHFGLNGIRERLQKLHGSLTIRSTPGKGSHIRFSIPLERHTETL